MKFKTKFGEFFSILYTYKMIKNEFLLIKNQIDFYKHDLAFISENPQTINVYWSLSVVRV